MIYVVLAIIVVADAIAIYSIRKASLNKTITFNNDEIKQQKETLKSVQQELNTVRQQLSSVQSEVQTTKSLKDQEIQSYVVSRQVAAETEVQEYLEGIEKQKKEWKQALDKLQLEKIKIESDTKDTIKQFEGVRAAVIEAQKREEQIKNDKDAFRIVLSEQDINDVHLLLDLSKRLNNPQALYKLIWSEYYQRPAQNLFARLLNKETFGIYKITSIKDEKIYIGRSVNIRERWIQHIKSALEIGNIAKTQLYTAMKDQGIENFTFEVLEECDKDKLAEREKFYIGLYKSNEWGYNLNSGG